VQIHGPIEAAPLQNFRDSYEVNVIGQVAVTQAFLPLLRQFPAPQYGRVIFIGSASGYTCVPFLGVYSSSKHAIEAVADSLRIELASTGIKVSLIEPGVFRTNMLQKFETQKEKENKDDALQVTSRVGLYPGYQKFLEGAQSLSEGYPTGEPVANLLVSLLFGKYPASRAAIGADAFWSYFMTSIYPDSAIDFIWKHNLARKVISFANSFKKKK